jgi:hypothetical protein
MPIDGCYPQETLMQRWHIARGVIKSGGNFVGVKNEMPCQPSASLVTKGV